ESSAEQLSSYLHHMTSHVTRDNIILYGKPHCCMSPWFLFISYEYLVLYTFQTTLEIMLRWELYNVLFIHISVFFCIVYVEQAGFFHIFYFLLTLCFLSSAWGRYSYH